MAEKVKNAKKRGPGKPRKVVTSAQMKRAEGYALDGCQNATIEGLMGWPNEFIARRDDIAKRLLKKRQQRKQKLRHAQFINATVNHSNTMQVFLGVNELEQRDVKTTDVPRQTLADIAAIVGAALPDRDEPDGNGNGS
ncbi:MAG: hypothetical protein ACYSX1_11120 [Planctomycetota bacterium]